MVDVQEKIIGEDTLRHIYILNQALEAAKGVVHLRVSKGAGTGFMISPDLLMTNNHVIASQEEAEKTEYTFNYQLIATIKSAAYRRLRRYLEVLFTQILN